MITTTQYEFPISEEAFLYMKLLANRCGIDLSIYRKDALYNRLVKRLRALKLRDFDEYCNYLRFDIEEEIKFINLITNSTTSFFRENHHFDFLATKVLPELITEKEKIRIWSAGCSTGEEPYSIAITAAENIPDFSNCDIKILATDINSDSLAIAEKGIYTKKSLSKINPVIVNKWFLNANKDFLEVKESLKALITFRQLNLMENWPLSRKFDVIFCRNVIIYFTDDIQKTLLKKFHHFLETNGYLFLGHSENIKSLKNDFQCIGKSIFKKCE